MIILRVSRTLTKKIFQNRRPANANAVMKNLRSSASLCNAARRVCGAALLAISAFTCEVCLGAVCTALALSGQRFKAGYKLPINANKAASLVLARMGSMESKGFMLKKSSAT